MDWAEKLVQATAVAEPAVAEEGRQVDSAAVEASSVVAEVAATEDEVAKRTYTPTSRPYSFECFLAFLIRSSQTLRLQVDRIAQ